MEQSVPDLRISPFLSFIFRRGMAVGELAGGGLAGPCDGGDDGPGDLAAWRPMGKVVEEAD